MTRTDIVDYCLAKPGAFLDEPWEGDEVAKVGGKIFAFFGGPGGPDRVGLKCGRSSEEAAEMRARYPEHVTISAYTGRHGWNTVDATGVPDDELCEWIDASYDAVVASLPRAKRPIS
jgi:predicted DNA-binding protein (MmcQ/YjbR family)